MIVSKLKTESAFWPITLTEAKAQLNIDAAFTGDDTFLTTLIKVASNYYRNRTQRQLTQATYQLVMDAWYYSKDYCLQLPTGPLVKVNKIEYYNTSGSLTELATSEYRSNTFPVPAEIQLFGSLPSLYDRKDAVIIEYVAGYGADGATEGQQQAAIDELDKQIIKVLLTDLYEYRGENVAGSVGTVSRTVDELLSERRLFTKTFFEYDAVY